MKFIAAGFAMFFCFRRCYLYCQVSRSKLRLLRARQPSYLDRAVTLFDVPGAGRQRKKRGS
jgi:hypothetical protein